MVATLVVAGAAAGGPVVALLAHDSGADFREHSGTVLAKAEYGAQQANTRLVLEAKELFNAGVGSAASAMGRELVDHPFGLHGVDREAEARLKAEIDELAAKVEGRTKRNGELVSQFFSERARAELDAKLTSVRLSGATEADRFATHLGRRTAVWGSIALSLVVLAGAGLLFWTVIRPLRGLESTIGRMASGDLAARVDVGRGDEMGRLGAGFNRLADQIEQGRAALLEANQQLEARVAERTRDLEASLKELHDARYRLVRAARISSVAALSAGVAHEFGNVLGGIAGTAEEAAADAADPGAKEALEVIGRTARRGFESATKLLEGAQSRELGGEPVSLDRAADEACELLAAEAAGAGVTLRRDLAPGLVHADPGDLQQVTVNLLRNAMRAAGRGGTVEVVVRREGDRMGLEVSDSGPGLSAEQAETLFDPFAPGRADTDESGATGAGLGLFITEAIVSAHGGSIDVGTAGLGGAKLGVWFARLPEEGASA
jgi:signal transduction histidine kinase